MLLRSFRSISDPITHRYYLVPLGSKIELASSYYVR